MAETLNVKSIVSELEELFEKHNLNEINERMLLTRCLNESWFSDTLAWLLDPKGSHGLGVKFANKFLNKIANIRTNSEVNYKRLSYLLKEGKAGKGTSSNNFSLKNSSVVREFYLSSNYNSKRLRKNMFCDVVYFDLDPGDSLFVLIENKLFTKNHPEQLQQYWDMARKKYQSKVMEFVYLTIDGSAPIIYPKDSEDTLRYWVRMSWTEDIKDILSDFINDDCNHILKDLYELLKWMDTIKIIVNTTQSIENLRNAILLASSECLIQELKRLNKKGNWEISRIGKRIKIAHSSVSKRNMYIEILPNLNVTIQSKKGHKPLYEKIIVPFGTNTDQVYNMLDISCRDIYKHTFDKTSDYLNENRRVLNWKDIKYEGEENMKVKYKEFFDSIAKNHNILKIMYTISNYAKESLIFEEEGLIEDIE